MNVGSSPRPIEPKTSAMYSSVKEIGTPTKMMPIMLASMISPRISLPVIAGRFRRVRQDLSRRSCRCRPQRLQQLRDALANISRAESGMTARNGQTIGRQAVWSERSSIE